MCKCGVRGDMNVMMVQVKEEKKCEGGMYAVVTVFLNAMIWDDMGRCEKRKNCALRGCVDNDAITTQKKSGMLAVVDGEQTLRSGGTLT